MIKELSCKYPVTRLCKYLKVSTSSYYRWLKTPIGIRNISDEIYKGIILRFYKDHNSCYGAKRVYELLKNDNYRISKDRVARLYKELGLKSKADKKWKNTTNSKHNKLVADNVLKQNFSAEKPNEKWVSDITYISTKEGWLYLCVIIDLYSRKVVGWSMEKRMKDDLVCNALLNALFSRGHPKGVIIHSDRVSQYCSYKFYNLVKKYSLISSMSSTGCCYDNAACVYNINQVGYIH